MSGETRAHWELKRAALYWAQVQGYGIAGVEVRVPGEAIWEGRRGGGILEPRMDTNRH
jgi:hypothetical protein